MALQTLVLMISLKNNFAYPKYPLKKVQKPMNHVYQKILMYNNVV